MSVVKLKRKGGCVRSGEVELDRAWPLSASWIQTLRHPNQLAAVCLDGYLGMDFTEEDDSYYRRAAVQHLGLFIPWHAFLCESSGEINRIWETKKTRLSKRMTWLADNIQLLRRSAEDVARDARQWAALSGEGDPTADAVGSGSTEGHDAQGVEHRPGGVGLATRLIDVLRNAMTRKEITAGSKEISSMVEQMYRFQATALDSTDDLRATVIPDHDAHILGGSISRAEIPRQEQLRSIKSQQNGLSREREKMIQGLQNQLGGTAAADGVAAHSGSDRPGQQDDPTTHADQRGPSRDTGPSTGVMFGPSTSFCETGRQVAESFTLNQRQSIALQLICRQLDRMRHDDNETPQLCQFIGGEGGTGKSRVIAAIAELFVRTGQSHRLLLTATSGTAAANINGITIHSACRFSKDTVARVGRAGDPDGVASSGSAALRIDGQTKMDWQEKQVLIIDEFRPVQERSILLPSASTTWEGDNGFGIEQRRQHDTAHALWRKFTTVVLLDEQVRAAQDPRLRGLLTRIRKGVQDQSDVEYLNSHCYQEGRRIPWESGITVVTPLNRNRWNLNIEATLAFRKQWQRQVRIFVSEHRWKDNEPTEEEAIMMLGQGDDSTIPVPAIFMFVPGMPVVVNKNTHQGLKLVNGASYTAQHVILDKAHPGHQIDADTVLHFGPPAGILLGSETTRDFRFIGIPPGTVLLTPTSVKIECQRKRPWQQVDVSRRGLPCAPAFACTDYKVQGRTLDLVALELRGTRTTNIDGQAVPSQCDPYSLYVQLSRCRTLDGIILLSRAREHDLIGNTVPAEMAQAELRLEQLSEETLKGAESRDWLE
ncbi:hypothetical protein FOC1_g10001068 [Fusarium oxysporum f. sp. cubense race 1]|uniref:ATP-dependent DNA helicase n=1 Tax=Fusarium oxysporum f. sp. cubense (strain race 1) TaxID=1229664 RepID=N4UTB8_FUSC1|nr:hypothetical protein FOC1_g10001068 [Fusarium oxysporum f. sp. cubense race 1]